MDKRQAHRQLNGRFSVRASIALWMVLAGLIWATLALGVSYATRWGDASLEAQARRLSTIAPAAGQQTAPDPAQK
jgi:hypothetical protein